MELLDKLNWCYATKVMNGQKVPQEKIENIIKAISLSPTSSRKLKWSLLRIIRLLNR